MLSWLHFANSWALLAGIAAPLLLLAYRRKRSQKKQVVSSVLILKTLAKRRTIHRRVKPPLRAFVELLALLLLVLAAAVPLSLEKGERVALLVDTSLSMRARGEAPYGTRFEEAKQKAAKWLDERSSDTVVRVFSGAPRLISLTDEPISASAAQARLAELQPGYSSDVIDGAVAELMQSGDFDMVVVVTDRAPELLEQQQAAKTTDSALRRTTLEVLPVGAPVANAYFGNVVFTKSGLQGEAGKVAASVGFSGNAPQQMTLRLYRTAADDVSQRSLLKTAEVTVQPETFAEVAFDIGEREASPLYQLELSLPGPADALADDNTAWLSAETAGQTRVLLVTPDEGVGDLGLGALPSLAVEQLSASRYAALNGVQLSRYSLLLFHRTAPTQIPPHSSLLVLPPSGNTIFPVLREASEPKISSWNAEHPLTLYLRVPLLRPLGSVLFSVPPWAQEVITAEQGALLVAGERRGRRYAAVGFELLPFEGAQTPSTSVLTLNLLNWLTGSSSLAGSYLTGNVFRLEEGSWQVNGPTGAERLTVAAGETRAYELSQPGAYRFSRDSAGSAEDQRVSVNSFYPQESATFTPAPLVAPRSVPHQAADDELGTPLWHYAFYLALLFLLIESLMHILPKEQTA